MKYKNPVIKGFNPDPSVCRVGSDYYLATSTFEFFPGIAIYHSRDLVNWELINHCIKEPEKLDYSQFGNSGGIWAPSIRYNRGRFYVTVTIDGMGNVITYTDDVTGDWSELIPVAMRGIDPSLYFEDGRAFYCTNENSGHGEAVTLCEIDPDTGRLIGEKKEIWHGIGEGWLEAPHVYKVGDWYYVFTAEGGTAHNHMITVGRSRTLFGEYESCPFNPILTNRNDTSKSVLCAGHGDLTEDEKGNFYIVHLATRPCSNRKSNLGRETFLTPVQYRDGWFRAVDSRAKIENEIDMAGEQKTGQKFATDFTGEKFEREWLFLNYENAARNNGLELSPEGGKLVFAGVRQPDFECEVSTELEFCPQKAGDEAGLMLYLQSDFNYRLCKVREADGDYIEVRKRAEDFTETVYREKAEEGKLRVCVKADKAFYRLYYSAGEAPLKEICRASSHFLCVETPERCFTGTLAGVYAEGSAKARFLSFEAEATVH